MQTHLSKASLVTCIFKPARDVHKETPLKKKTLPKLVSHHLILILKVFTFPKLGYQHFAHRKMLGKSSLNGELDYTV